MDGLEFLKCIHSIHPDTLRILITAYGDNSLFAEALQMGVEDYIAKPFTSEIIEASLSRLLEKSGKDTIEH
jgi:YesN/AraC family two-component response regulator